MIYHGFLYISSGWPWDFFKPSTVSWGRYSKIAIATPEGWRDRSWFIRLSVPCAGRRQRFYLCCEEVHGATGDFGCGWVSFVESGGFTTHTIPWDWYVYVYLPTFGVDFYGKYIYVSFCLPGCYGQGGPSISYTTWVMGPINGGGVPSTSFKYAIDGWPVAWDWGQELGFSVVLGSHTAEAIDLTSS